MKAVSVTQAIRDSGAGPDFSSVPEAYLRAKAALGSAVHSICAEAVKGTLRIPKGEAGPLVRSFGEWVKNSGARILRTEFEVRGFVNGVEYCGHPDIEADWCGWKWVLDLKVTSTLYSSYGLQLAAYRRCMGPSYKRGILWLRPGKPAKLVCEPPIVRDSDEEMFKAILISRAWMQGAKL